MLNTPESLERKKIYILDRYTNKNFELSVPREETLSLGTKIIFKQKNTDGKIISSVGTYIGEKFSGIDRKGRYVGPLTVQELQEFDEQQNKARKLFPLFKKLFKQYFPVAIPVTARYHMFTNQRYFYFYSEERFNFVHFIKEFRQQITGQFFLFQIGARDMIKMSPGTDHIVGCNGRNLCCKSNRPLPSIDVEALLVQHLDGRDIERLKGRCGKLKCSLLYEVETYISESKKYPSKGSRVMIQEESDISTDCQKCGMVTNFNIQTQKVAVQLDSGARIYIDLEEIKKIYKKNTSVERKPLERSHRRVGSSSSRL